MDHSNIDRRPRSALGTTESIRCTEIGARDAPAGRTTLASGHEQQARQDARRDARGRAATHADGWPETWIRPGLRGAGQPATGTRPRPERRWCRSAGAGTGRPSPGKNRSHGGRTSRHRAASRLLESRARHSASTSRTTPRRDGSTSPKQPGGFRTSAEDEGVEQSRTGPQAGRRFPACGNAPCLRFR